MIHLSDILAAWPFILLLGIAVLIMILKPGTASGEVPDLKIKKK